MKKLDRQIHYWAHMLDECRFDEAENSEQTRIEGAPSTLTITPDASPADIVDDVTDDKLEDVCQNLEFMLHSDDHKVRALYTKFKEGFKDKFDGLKCKVGYVSIKNLHPTQNVIFLEKSIKPMLDGSWIDKDHGGQPVVKSLLDKNDSKQIKLGYLVVCNVKGTNYLIDGHHRWSKAYMINPNAKMYAYVLPSEGIFNSEDDVLKFAQCEIALYLGRNNSKNHPVNTDANKANDINLYKTSDSVIKAKVEQFLTDEVIEIFANPNNVLDGQYDTRAKIADYVARNKDVMVKNAPAGIHDRTFMPQYPDANGPGDALSQINESRCKMSKKYTRRQIEQHINRLKRKLHESRLDLDDDLDLSNIHSTAQIDQNLNDFLSIFSGKKVSVHSPDIDLVAKALCNSIDVAKLKDHISKMKSLGISHESFKKAVSALDSLVYFVKCMDEFNSKTSLDGFEDDVY